MLTAARRAAKMFGAAVTLLTGLRRFRGAC
jgi:hypothetical protein